MNAATMTRNDAVAVFFSVNKTPAHHSHDAHLLRRVHSVRNVERVEDHDSCEDDVVVVWSAEVDVGRGEECWVAASFSEHYPEGTLEIAD